MKKNKKNIRLISNFNLDTYYNFLNQKIDSKKYKLIKPNFGLFYDSCFEIINGKSKNHIILIWSTIEGVIKSFQSLLNKIELIYYSSTHRSYMWGCSH